MEETITAEETAKYLFVSHPHARTVLASGRLLEVLPINSSSRLEIDATSAQEYRVKNDAAARAWLGSPKTTNRWGSDGQSRSQIP